MLTKIEYVKDIWTDHAGDRSAVVIMDEGEWTKIQYQLEGDKDITVAFLPPTYAVVLTAHLDAANARIAELEAHSAAKFVEELHRRWIDADAHAAGYEGYEYIDLYREIEHALLAEWNLADKQQEA
jgi:hypothetical protein